jgi:lysozyme family protein
MSSTLSTQFLWCFNTIVSPTVEGGYTDSPADPGNWTDAAVGQGTLKGTKYGISASAYPDLDIANLTLDQAKTIYYTDYYAPIQGDMWPAPLSLILFDGAINQGISSVVKSLQAAIGVTQDGNLGIITENSTNSFIKEYTNTYLCSLVLKNRLESYMNDSDWAINKDGWINRLFTIALTASAGES